MAWFRRASDVGTGEHGQTLVAQADTKEWDVCIRSGFDDALGGTKVFFPFRSAWPRGDHHMAEFAVADSLGQVSSVMCRHNKGFNPAHLSDEVGEVERVGIVIINEQDHYG